jgi:hypothetical protein
MDMYVYKALQLTLNIDAVQAGWNVHFKSSLWKWGWTLSELDILDFQCKDSSFVGDTISRQEN